MEKHYYIAPWEWITDTQEGISYWQAPGGDAVGSLDIRSRPQMGKAGGTPQGYGIFAYKKKKSIPGSIYLGKYLNRSFTSSEKASLSKLLKKEIDSNTPKNLIWDLFTKHSDPTGETGPKPLRGMLRNQVRLVMGGQLIKSEPFNNEHRDRTIAVFQADYRKNVKKGIPLDVLRKWTGDTMRKMYGRMGNDLIASILPKEYRKNGWKIPATRILDDFNRSDESLDARSWVEVSGSLSVLTNEVGPAATGADGATYARHTVSLSSDAHYSQIDFTNEGSDNLNYAAPAVRITTDSSDATVDLYYGFLRGGGAASELLRKRVDGVNTTLDSGTTTHSPTFTVKLEATADDVLTVYKGGGR